MTPRALVSSLLCASLIATSMPRIAHAADEPVVPTLAEALPTPFSPEGVRARLALASSTQFGSAARGPFAPTPTEIRLSPEAKTAIIIGAVIVGVLIIVGAVVVAKPGKIKP